MNEIFNLVIFIGNLRWPRRDIIFNIQFATSIFNSRLLFSIRDFYFQFATSVFNLRFPFFSRLLFSFRDFYFELAVSIYFRDFYFLSSVTLSQGSYPRWNRKCLFRNAANDDHLHNNKTQNRPTLSIEINRHNVKNDMLKVFSDESILSFNIEVVFKDNMGNVEKGTGSGLIREAFSLFWNEAYDSWMLGVEKRIPFIRHDYQRVQWEAVGRILVAGYQSCQYFPLQLSKCKTFVAYCLFGAAVVTDAMLIDSFKRYVCDTEREVIEKRLKG